MSAASVSNANRNSFLVYVRVVLDITGAKRIKVENRNSFLIAQSFPFTTAMRLARGNML